MFQALSLTLWATSASLDHSLRVVSLSNKEGR